MVKLKTPLVSFSVRKLLYASAEECYRLAPWEVMDDGIYFSIKIKDETFYACVMGMNGEFVAIAFYIGTAGYHFIQKIKQEKITAADIEARTGNDCLMVEYVRAKELSKENKDLLKLCAISVGGNRLYPNFISYKPGYVPCAINEAEALTLQAALKYVPDALKKFQEDGLEPDDKRRGTIYTYHAELEGKTSWEKLPSENSDLALEKVPFGPKDAAAYITFTRQSGGVWQAHCTYLNHVITSGQRHYYVFSAVVCDLESGAVLCTELGTPQSHGPELMKTAIMNSIQKHSVLPERIEFKDSSLIGALEHLGRNLNIKLVKNKSIKAVDEYLKALSQIR
jgi:hypothetical protein